MGADLLDAGAPSAIRSPVPAVNFDRRLVCLLGLPFDAIGIDEAVQRIRTDAFSGRRCWVTTPNLNFAMAALGDQAFRDSVLRSDLSLIDGMPLVWIARLLGVSVPGRVAGSDLFAALQAYPGPPLNVYLFGGPPGAAPLACERINRSGGGIRCVGFDEPGFGSVDSMSSWEIVSRINQSNAHFVLVSLGARKGQAWIERNAAHLTAPVLSHLGAVLNFAAGTVGRAPPWIRASGLEWLWRIKEEPLLWRRYGSDGIRAVYLLLTRVVPDALAAGQRHRNPLESNAVELERTALATTVKLRGAWSAGDEAPLRAALRECASDGAPVTIDLSGVTVLAGAAVALLMLARGWFGQRGGFRVVGVSATLSAKLSRMLVDRALLDGHQI